MKRNTRDLSIIFGVTVAVIVLLALFVGIRKGDVSLSTLTEGAPDADITVPYALDETDTGAKDESDGQTAADMQTQEVTFQTSEGDITLELFTEAMPVTTGNFLELARSDFYDGTKFHRVIEGFMIQGGDPNSKSSDTSTYGQGGPGYTIEDEFVEDPVLTNIRGTIAMANTGQPNSSGSQFFINLADNTFLDFDQEPLSSKHPVFGRVVSGMDVVDRIATTETLPADIPAEPIVLEDVVVASADE